MVNPALGVFLHAVGGLAAGSFYIPYKKVKGWAWESYWLVGGFFSWIIVPWVIALLTVKEPMTVLSQAPPQSVGLCYFFGVLWGIGGLTFGLTMRYLGMSLGYAMALGLCAAFGTLMPPLFDGSLFGMLAEKSGLITLLGVVVCLVGIALGGKAGIHKEKELPEERKKDSVREFNFKKGVWVAFFCGIMSACMSYGIKAGEPIANLSVEMGTAHLWQNGVVFIIILAGGFTTNFLWCVYLNLTNKTGTDYLTGEPSRLLANYFFSAVAGTTWYFQFMFYGMGTTQMGAYDFSSWTLHMAFIIIFSNMWGIIFKEWLGTSRRTHLLITAAIVVLILSTIIVGYGSYLAPAED